ncbi:hypothetical protein PUNSTDRAFT_137822 [Punctularia strigosozonata HHB-11173 SS5]|uniref:Uncharacterized protein n=1 Tax=Punctularia strigosozonata (strain HHB-11173) TaxID=741275 RepID=R7S433_PUNST|nr:uncharacterized protein PUNSTDRAFT_137822 [Punctularia strigosozonata HHB-11173 SS5]EIN05140.1 hypothetical protein PUNSTDRAFT_137822 [Punctularia strigosozonata HHB-11173 SS5]
MASAKVPFIPDNTNGSVTKLDMRIGGLLAEPATGADEPYAPVFPVGFYTSFGGFLADNLTAPRRNQSRRGTPSYTTSRHSTISPPSTPYAHAGARALPHVRDALDVHEPHWRHGWGEPDQEQTEPYTGDESDGWEDPLNATQLAYVTIYGLDSGCHPVSLVLSCQDSYFTEYSAGADIVMQDMGTVCTPDYGDCGCDNCKGAFEDISDWMTSTLASRSWAANSLSPSGLVPQAFGNDTYWKRYPTGAEYTVSAALTINHGVVAWGQPAPDDLLAAASALAAALEPAKAFILSPEAEYAQSPTDRVDVASWTVGSRALLLVTNLNYEAKTVPIPAALRAAARAGLKQVLDTGAKIVGENIVLESVGTGAFILGR